MKLGEAISNFTSNAQTGMTTAQIISHISNLDGKINDSVFSLYPGSETFEGYPSDEDLSTVLLAAFPYEDIYFFYLMAMNALADGESDSYENYSALYNTLFGELARSYHRKAQQKNTVITCGGGICSPN